MGIFYKCLSGDSEHIGLSQTDAFAVLDSSGRNWICYPLPEAEVDTLSMRGHLHDVQTVDATARRFGLSMSGTEVRIYYCDGEDELAEKLAEKEP